ncbi:MAG: metallophosphoesterase [Ruminococcus sp.]|nr:metallophosphoesterase [Ruminococcus sp.]
MRIIVFSDTHGNYSAMHKIFKRNGTADLFIFLGDGLNEFLRLKAHYLDWNIIGIKGNCDFSPDMPDHDIITLKDGRKIFFAHGDKWAVRFTLDRIYNKAKEEGCCIALFGHTHVRYAEQRGDVLILNPGSAGQPRDGLPASYAWIDLTDSGITYNHVDL